MEIILYLIRDRIVSVHYVIYVLIILFLIFAIIGYLFKQKYAKVAIKIDSNQTSTNKESKKEVFNTVNHNTSKTNLQSQSASANQKVINQAIQSSSQKNIQSANNQSTTTAKPQKSNLTNNPVEVNKTSNQTIPIANNQSIQQSVIPEIKS